MVRDQLAMEHYRLHVVEAWPDGLHKQAVLETIRESLATLTERSPAEVSEFGCIVCGAETARLRVVARRRTAGTPPALAEPLTAVAADAR